MNMLESGNNIIFNKEQLHVIPILVYNDMENYKPYIG